MISPAHFFYLPSAVILYSPTASGAAQVSKTNHLIETLQLEESQLVGSEPCQLATSVVKDMNWGLQ